MSLGLNSAASLLMRMVDEENIDQIMRMVPKYLMKYMQIEAGRDVVPPELHFHGYPPAELHRVEALRTWLVRNGHSITDRRSS